MEILPVNIEEAIDLLKNFFKENLEEIKNMSEDEFSGSVHHSGGMFIRNSWLLWWHKDHKYEQWPKEIPKLNQWFNNLGIWHADDMSGILMTSLHRSLRGEDLEIDKQVQHYLDYWKEQGVKSPLE
jgi:hypothetical protein